jgi:hypothetical protein
MIIPKTKEIRCRKCWGLKDGDFCTEYWHHTPINEEMDQLSLQHEAATNSQFDENDLDWQNELAYQAVKRGHWKSAQDNFERNADRRDCWSKWKNMSQFILCEACENPECPEHIIEYLVTKGGPNRFHGGRPCINSGGIGAMTCPAVAAEKGNITALRVFVRENTYNDFHWPAVCAFRANQPETFEFLWDTYVSQGPDLQSTLRHDFAVYRMIETAKEENLDKSLTVIQKFFPDEGISIYERE